jgi:uncharacterized RDD family membrane protein YckC
MASSPASFAATVEPAGRSEIESPVHPTPPLLERHRAKPAALSRRVGAGLVDLIWIGIPTILVARMTGESTLASGPSASISTSRLETVEQAGPWRVTLTLADHGVGLSAAGLAMTLLTLTLATVLATVIVPLLDEGRTPGMALFRLRIVGVGRRRPTARALLIRTTASALDLMPVAVPGLVGFAFAASNPQRQRIGDRLARTAVVHEPRTSRTGDASIEPILRFAGSGDGTWPSPRVLNPSRFRPDLGFDTIAQLSPGLGGLAVASPGWTLGGPPSMTNHSAATHGPASAGRLLDRPPVAERPLFNPYPKPQRPVRHREQNGTVPGQSRSGTSASSKTNERQGEDSTARMSSSTPEWNEQWHSWVYWDDDRRQWLRFDAETGEWEPMA